MDVLVFLGSPRKKGNSEVLTEALLEGVRDEGGMPEIIRLCDLKISPCISCGGCDKKGICVVEDDMTPLYEKIISTDKIILASPIFSMASPPRPKLSSTEPRHSGTVKGFYKGKESGLTIRSERAFSSPLPQPVEPRFLQEQSSP